MKHSYTVDGILPHTVLLPSSEAEVASMLRAAAQEGSVVVAWGGRKKEEFGNPMERVDVVLSLERLNQVVDYVPADMTITVQAGMRFADLQALTARHGQTVPLDPARASAATIGGIVATGGAGPRRMAFGGVRDLLLGARLALVDGRVIRAGGKVVKNVAGYDVPKLVSGSLGTLGVITEVSLKLRPLPADSRTLLFGFGELATALDAAESILNSELLAAAVVVVTPQATCRLEAPGPVALAVALEESLENNAYQVDRLSRYGVFSTLTGATESAFWDRLINYGDVFGSALRWRVNTVVSDLVNHLLGPLDGIAYVSTGTVMLYGDDGEAAAGSCAVLESGAVDLRRKVNVWGPPRTEWKFTEGSRRAFDPGRILNRGRYVGGN